LPYLIHRVASGARYVFLSKEKYRVRISVQADEGDEVSISADFISVEQATVTLEIENTSYDSQPELESVTLSIDKAP
jgi:predicted secreted protein